MSVTTIELFRPDLGETVSISATDSSGSAAVTISENTTIAIANTGSSLAYISYGTSAPTATTSDYPILAGSKEVIGIPHDTTHVAAICDSGNTTTVKFTPGTGA